MGERADVDREGEEVSGDFMNIVTATTADTLTINWAGGCACPVRWPIEYRKLAVEVRAPDPWREIDAGLRATAALLGGRS